MCAASRHDDMHAWASLRLSSWSHDSVHVLHASCDGSGIEFMGYMACVWVHVSHDSCAWVHGWWRDEWM